MFQRSFSRSANAIVLAMGVITVVAALLAASASSSVSQNQFAVQRVQQIDALAAAEAVISRRESMVLRKASDGTLFDWTGIDGQEPNFGEEFFGDCVVRWKIEPARSIRAEDIGQPADEIDWIENPPPDVGFEPTGAQQTNDYVYLFRIAADASKPGSGNFETTRAQAVRYVAINQEPLFRYVIFYAPRGPKGDLELSHVDDLNVYGSVHTNGALYLGSNTTVNTWATRLGEKGHTRLGPIDFRDLNDNGVLDPGEPTNVPVRVNGVDGIFRLSKPLMFSVLNSLPVPGQQPGGFNWETAYNTTAGTPFLRDAVTGIDAVQLAAVENKTRDAVDAINPYRAGAAFATTNEYYTGIDKHMARTINDRTGVSRPILGVDEGTYTRNDARDGSAADAPGPWRTNSMNEFGGQARTNETGGRIKRLPEELIGTEDLPLRPLEAQTLQYMEVDGDPTTDDHEFAQPLFRTAGGVTTNPAVSATELGSIVEAPGRYLGLALGSGRNLARRTDGTGWDVVQDNGTAAADNGQRVGLVIRERPAPAVALWPGTDAATMMGPSDPNYMPYAYGKHFRPFNWPFFIADVSDHVSPGAQHNSWGRFGLTPSPQDATRDTVNNTSDTRNHTYEEGGTVRLTAAVAEGRADFDANDRTIRPAYHADNWRFVHLKRPGVVDVSTLTPGVTVRYFKDTNPVDQSIPDFYPNSGNWPGFNLLGDPWEVNGAGLPRTYVRPYIDSTDSTAANKPWPTDFPGLADDDKLNRFSIRIEAYLVPANSGIHRIVIPAGSGADDGMRVWLDGRLMTNPGFWVPQGDGNSDIATDFALEAGRAYHLVVEHYDAMGGERMVLHWRQPGQTTSERIPTGTSTSTTDPITNTVTTTYAGLYQLSEDPGFSRTAFTAVETRLRPSDFRGVAEEKAVLKIRSNAAGLSPLLSGRDRYIAIGYNPVRGVFVQRRLEPAKQTPSQLGNFGFYTGGGTAQQSINGAAATTVNADAAGIMPTATDRNNTPVQYGGTVTYNYPDYTRNGRVNRVEVSPITTTIARWPDSETSLQLENSYIQANPYTVNLGDGNTVKVWAGIANGVKQAKHRRRPQAAFRESRSKDVTLGLVTGTGRFKPEHVNRRLNIFDLTNTGTTNLESGWGGDIQWVNATGTQVGLRFTTTSTNSAPSLGTETENKVPTGDTQAEDNWVWGASEATITKMNANATGGRSDWKAAPQGNVNGDGRVYAAQPAVDYNTVPEVAPTTASDPYQWNIDSERSFAVADGTNTVTVLNEVNSYVTAYGTWFNTPVGQVLPWNNAWQTNYTVRTQALTHSYPPHLWAGTGTAPGEEPIVGVSPSQSVVPLVGGGRWSDDQPGAGAALPATVANATSVWLRIERVPATASTFRFRYALTENPAPGDWTSVLDQAGAEVTADVSSFGDFVLAGPAVQSGSRTAASTINFERLRVEFNGGGTPADVVDASDWDQTAGTMAASAMSRYLASQYQVFWGVHDITEDFFTYAQESVEGRTATEDWIYSPREFWSQSRTWDNGVEKDTDPDMNIANRVLWSKTTMLSLNLGGGRLINGVVIDDAGLLGVDRDSTEGGTQLGGIQGYLRSRTVSDAVRPRITGGAAPTVPGGNVSLWEQFNGLIYAARTNRYPYNPNRDPGLNQGRNPWSFAPDRSYPNTTVAGNANEYASLSIASPADWDTYLHQGIHRLQPYPALVAPPIKPQEFHHGVRIWNGARIFFGLQNNTLEENKLSIVTPNQLYLHGDLNLPINMVTTPNSPTTQRNKASPMAVFGDAVHLLSNAFRLDRWQTPGISMSAAGDVEGEGVLKNPIVHNAADTKYFTCILTHNIPTTRHSVREGQGAAFVDTMMFMENWTGRTMEYTGSLVVLDSRRYSRAFLLDGEKAFGRTVFGNTISAQLGAADRTAWEAVHGVAEWTGQTPTAYTAPKRVYKFNDDLLLEQGTPPFTPFGLTVSGLGGWSRIIQ